MKTCTRIFAKTVEVERLFEIQPLYMNRYPLDGVNDVTLWFIGGSIGLFLQILLFAPFKTMLILAATKIKASSFCFSVPIFSFRATQKRKFAKVANYFFFVFLQKLWAKESHESQASQARRRTTQLTRVKKVLQAGSRRWIRTTLMTALPA